MYRTASRSRASQRAAERSSDRGIKHARYTVIAFRMGVDNQGRARVYRRVWAEAFWDAAIARVQALSIRYGYWAIIDSTGSVHSANGQIKLAYEWERTRRGINKGADWNTAATYSDRESGHDRTAIAEHNNLEETRQALSEGGWRVPR